MYRLLVAISVLVIQFQPMVAQNTRERYWATLGTGFTFRESFFGSAFGIGFTYKPNEWLISTRYMNGDRVKGVIDFKAVSPLDHLRDLSLLAGLSQEGELTIFSIAAGPGLVNGKFNEIQNNRTFSVVGISLEGQAIFKLTRSLGLGGYLYSNFNSEASYVGIWLSLQFGYLR